MYVLTMIFNYELFPSPPQAYLRTFKRIRYTCILLKHWTRFNERISEDSPLNTFMARVLEKEKLLKLTDSVLAE